MYVVTEKWNLFECDVLCTALLAVFTASSSSPSMSTSIFCNLDTKIPILRPAAEN